MTGTGMVLKVQLPLALTGDQALALIYNKDRSLEKQVPISRYLLMLLEKEGGYKPKAYFEAWVDGDSIVMGSEVEDPGW